MSPEPWDDGIADGLALVEAAQSGDTEGVRVILRHGNAYEIAVVLAKLLSEVVIEQDVDPVHFRRWGADAVRRG